MDENVPVRNLLGCLLYIANMTRPDIAAAVNFLARHLHRPNRLVWKYGKHILAYLKHTKHQKLNIGHLDDSNLVCYVDANYATPGDRKAQSGAILQFNGCSIGWFSKKQKTTSLSSTEAEYVALAAATKDVLWVQQLLNELTVPVRLPTVLYEDNLPAIQIANHQRNLSDTKHIDVKLHFLRDYCVKRFIAIHHVNTGDQLADSLTKVMVNNRHIARMLGSTSSGAGGVSK